MWSAILIIAAVIATLMAYTAYGHHRHLAASTGTSIDPASRPNTALLIIDFQEDFTSASAKQAYSTKSIESTLAAINALVETANENGTPVISVRQKFDGWYINLLVRLLNEGRGGASSDGLDLDARIDGDIDHDIVKSRADAFHEEKLDRILAQHGVGKLIVVGLDGEYCVNATITGALNRGYDVSFSDATTLTLNSDNWQKVKSRLIAAGAKDGISLNQKPIKSDKAKENEPA